MNGIWAHTEGFYIYYSDERWGIKNIFKRFQLKHY